MGLLDFPLHEELQEAPLFYVAPTDRDPAKEDTRQRAIVAMARRRGLFVAHIPQSGKRSDYERTTLHRNGAIAGVPDLVLAWDGGIYFAEVKDGRGKASFAQISVMNDLTRRGIPCGIHREWATVETALIEAGAHITASPDLPSERKRRIMEQRQLGLLTDAEAEDAIQREGLRSA